MIPSFGSSRYLTLALIACVALPRWSYADNKFDLIITSPSADTESVVVYGSDAGPAVSDTADIGGQDSVVITPINEIERSERGAVAPAAAQVEVTPLSAAAPVGQAPLAEVRTEEAPVVELPKEAPPINYPINNEASKDDDSIMVAQPVGSNPAQSTQVAPATDNMDSEGNENAEIAPAWQADFIRGLTGTDGVLSLDLQAVGQEERLQESVRLDEAVSIALQNNNELKASIAGVKSKEWDTMGTYSQYLPSVNLDVAVGRERSRPGSYNDSNGDRVLDNKHLRRDRSLLVRQPIMDLTVIADIFSAKDKQSIADIDKLGTRDTVALGTVTAYLKLLQSQVAIQLADQYRVYLDGLAKVMQARVDAGGATAADLDRVVSRSTLAESARMEAVGEFEINLAEFKRLTGVMPMKIVVPSRLAPDIPADMVSASKRAYLNNPTYLGALKKIDLDKDDRHKAYASMMPKVYAQYSGVYSYNAGGAANANPVDGVYATQRTDTAMIVAQWSINGLTPVAGALSAVEKEKQSYLQSVDVRKRMDQAIRANYTAVNSTKKRLAVLQKTVEANERVVKGFEDQYKSGTRSLFDLLDAYEQLYNSRLNLTRVIFAYTQASYQIRQQMGEIVPSIIDIKG